MVTVGCAVLALSLLQDGPSIIRITAKVNDKFEFRQEMKIEFPDFNENATTITEWGEKVAQVRPTEVAFSTFYTRDEVVGTAMADVLMEDHESIKGVSFICVRNHGNGILRFAKDGAEIKSSELDLTAEAAWPLTPILPGESWKEERALTAEGGKVMVTNTFRGVTEREGTKCYRITSEFAPMPNIKQTRVGETLIEKRTGRIWYSTFEYETTSPMPEALKEASDKELLVTRVTETTRRTNTIYAP